MAERVISNISGIIIDREVKLNLPMDMHPVDAQVEFDSFGEPDSINIQVLGDHSFTRTTKEVVVQFVKLEETFGEEKALLILPRFQNKSGVIFFPIANEAELNDLNSGFGGEFGGLVGGEFGGLEN